MIQFQSGGFIYIDTYLVWVTEVPRCLVILSILSIIIMFCMFTFHNLLESAQLLLSLSKVNENVVFNVFFGFLTFKKKKIDMKHFLIEH